MLCRNVMGKSRKLEAQSVKKPGVGRIRPKVFPTNGRNSIRLVIKVNFNVIKFDWHFKALVAPPSFRLGESLKVGWGGKRRPKRTRSFKIAGY